MNKFDLFLASGTTTERGFSRLYLLESTFWARGSYRVSEIQTVTAPSGAGTRQIVLLVLHVVLLYFTLFLSELLVRCFLCT